MLGSTSLTPMNSIRPASTSEAAYPNFTGVVVGSGEKKRNVKRVNKKMVHKLGDHKGKWGVYVLGEKS